MDRLARIEIQLIMNYLTRVELTLFSRCSRRLFSDGDTDLAWRTQPIYEIPNSDVTTEKWVSRSSAPTASALWICHQPAFSLRLTQKEAAIIGSVTCPTLTRLLASIPPRLVRVTFAQNVLSEASVWWTIIQQTLVSFPDLSECHLGSISIGLKLSLLLTTLRARTTKLTALTLPNFYSIKEEGADSAIGARSLPLLTNLTFTDVELQAPEEDEGATISTSIMKCERLTHLRINNLRLNVIVLNRVLTSSNLSRQLKDLTITWWRWVNKKQPGLCAELLRATWASMISLERLSFLQVRRMTPLVNTLQSCGSTLTDLHISATPFFHPDDPTEVSHYYPSSSCLHELLTFHPQLTIQYETNGLDIDGTPIDDPEAHPISHSLSTETKKRFNLIII